jgi:hypothetical protein
MKGYEFDVPVRGSNAAGSIALIPAGDISRESYWRHLAKIDWHRLFYSEEAPGVPFFLHLKELIRRDFEPDFLLIDSRTGITEIGGIATAILPDAVLCMLLKNTENLEGAREVMRSIGRTRRELDLPPANLTAVLTRIPAGDEPGREAAAVSETREFLCEPAVDLQNTAAVSDVFVLHSEPELEWRESLLIDSRPGTGDSALYLDYLRLCARIIPRDAIEPQIASLVSAAKQAVREDPDEVRRALETLADFCPTREPFVALTEFYKLRNMDPDLSLSACARYWALTGKADEPFLWEAVKEAFAPDREAWPESVDEEFLLSVWREAGRRNAEIGAQIAWHPKVGREGMKQIVRGVSLGSETSPGCLISFLRLATYTQDAEVGLGILDLLKQSKNLGSARDAWAAFIVGFGLVDMAREFFAATSESLAGVADSALPDYVEVFSMAGMRDRLRDELMRKLQQLNLKEYGQSDRWLIQSIESAFSAAGLGAELDAAVRRQLDKDEIDTLWGNQQRVRPGSPTFRREIRPASRQQHIY